MARLLFFVPFLLAFVSSVSAAIDYFMQMDGLILVDLSLNPVVQKAIQIQDYSLQVLIPPATFKTTFSDLVFDKSVDGNTPMIFQYLASSKVLNSVTVTAVDTSVTPPFIQSVYVFSQGAFTTQTLAASGTEPQTEKVAFSYGKLSMTHYTRNPDGSRGLTTAGSWNRITNTPTRGLPFAA